MDVEIRAVTESNLEDEVLVCVPLSILKDSPNYHKFRKGFQEKVEWLQQKVKDYGCIGNIAYNSRGEPLGFIEFVPAKGAPIPIEDVTDTALITCIYLPEMQGQGIGTRLLRAALEQLRKMGLPIEVVYFHSAHCPLSPMFYLNHINAIAKFSSDQVALRVIDPWKQPELARQYGSMFSDTFINGRAPFFGPPKQEDIEKDIQKEINRVMQLQGKRVS